MQQFEIYEGGVVWTNGVIGALLDDADGLWRPFQYFSSGDIDVEDVVFPTARGAFERAKEYYT
jgi:hypothetical protein